jgi:hypothetical protein
MGQKEVFFIVNGVIENRETGRFYSEGHIVHHEAIFFEDKQQPHFYALTKTVATLKFSHSDFK